MALSFEAIEVLPDQSRRNRVISVATTSLSMRPLGEKVAIRVTLAARSRKFPCHCASAGRLVLDPLSATIFSSDPDTYAAIQALEARGMPLADAIRKVAGLPWGER